MISPNALNNRHCTSHTLYRVVFCKENCLIIRCELTSSTIASKFDNLQHLSFDFTGNDSTDDSSGEVRFPRKPVTIGDESESDDESSNSLPHQVSVQLSKVNLSDIRSQGVPFRAVARKTTRSALSRSGTPTQDQSKETRTRAFAYKSTGGVFHKNTGVLATSGRTFASPRISTGESQ